MHKSRFLAMRTGLVFLAADGADFRRLVTQIFCVVILLSGCGVDFTPSSVPFKKDSIVIKDSVKIAGEKSLLFLDREKFRKLAYMENDQLPAELDAEYVKNVLPISDSWFRDSAAVFQAKNKFIITDTITLYLMDCSDLNADKTLLFTVDKYKSRITDYEFLLTKCKKCNTDTIINLYTRSVIVNGKNSYNIVAVYQPSGLLKYSAHGSESVYGKKENIIVGKNGKILKMQLLNL